MPKLSNPRHEAFAHFVAEGNSQKDSYAKAFDRHPDVYAESAGARLIRNDKVVLRIEEIQDRRARQSDVTVESICTELDEAKALAQREGQAGAYVQAVMGKAKLHGLITDKVKQETVIKHDPDDLSDDELAAIAAGRSENTPETEKRAPDPARVH